MASKFSVAAGKETKKHTNTHTQVPSPRTYRRTWSSSSSTCGDGSTAAAAPKCVCAPATHAGSFKCRLHRVNSHGHSQQSAPLPREPAVVSASSTRTVEAQ